MAIGEIVYMLSLKFLKNIIVIFIISLISFSGIYTIRGVILYNPMEIRNIEMNCLMILRELKLPGEIVNYKVSPGIHLLKEKTIINLKFNKKGFDKKNVKQILENNNWTLDSRDINKETYIKDKYMLIYANNENNQYYNVTIACI